MIDLITFFLKRRSNINGLFWNAFFFTRPQTPFEATPFENFFYTLEGILELCYVKVRKVMWVLYKTSLDIFFLHTMPTLILVRKDCYCTDKPPFDSLEALWGCHYYYSLISKRRLLLLFTTYLARCCRYEVGVS